MSEFRQTSECIQREFLKNFRGSHKLLQAHKKCAMEMKVEELEKTTSAQNIFDSL